MWDGACAALPRARDVGLVKNQPVESRFACLDLSPILHFRDHKWDCLTRYNFVFPLGLLLPDGGRTILLQPTHCMRAPTEPFDSRLLNVIRELLIILKLYC